MKHSPGKAPFPIRTIGIFELSYGCSFECPFCCVPWLDNSHLFGPLLTCNQWFRVIDRAIAEGVQAITLSGGEPFLNKDLPSIVEYLSKAYPECPYTIYTNGEFLSEAFLSKMVGTHGGIATTFQGVASREQLTGRNIPLTQLISICKQASNMGIPVDVAVLVCKQNLQEVEELIRLALSVNPRTVQINPVIIEGRAKSHSELWLSHSEIETLKSWVMEFRRKVDIPVLIDNESFCACRNDAIPPTGFPKIDLDTNCQECLRFLVIGPNGVRRKCLHTLEPLEQWP